ncbi:MAG: carboxypeptidase-like regulatory domain-containing protein [Vicingaceae bacterium]|nr:carboxypeptidase-like regulatory domain-containing protein [Vicingaceae bacterium]
MNLLRIIAFTTIFIFSAPLLIAQEVSVTDAKILSQYDSTIITGAHIINLNSKIGVVSNNNGDFTIQTELNDTLLISFIGYHSLKIEASEITTNIYLKKETYIIEPYTVLPYKNFEEFKEAFVNLELKDTAKNKINPSIMALVKPFNPSNLNMKITFNGPISGIAAKFNKRIKDKNNYLKLLARDKHKAFLATKFNSNIVSQATLLKDESQIKSFMEYCDFTEHFIEFSSHYNLVDQIVNCFEEYQNLPIAVK